MGNNLNTNDVDPMSIPRAFLIDSYKEILPKLPFTQQCIKSARELLATGLPWANNGDMAPRQDGPYVVAYVEYGDNPILQFKTDGYVYKSRGGLDWNINGNINVLSYLTYGEVFKSHPVRYIPLPDTKGKERRFEKLSKLLKYVKNENDVEDVSDICISPLYVYQNEYLVHAKRMKDGKFSQSYGFCKFD